MRRQFVLLVAVRAADMSRGNTCTVVEEVCAEERETADVVRANVGAGVQGRVIGARVRTTEPIPWCIVGNERRFVELDRDTEEEAEIVLDERVLVLFAVPAIAVPVILIHQSLGPAAGGGRSLP